MFLIYLYYTLKYVTVNDAIYEFVLTLPQGYDTLVSEMGTNLSDGQRRQIAIVRALIMKPCYLILDEACGTLEEVGENSPTYCLFVAA
jgi:ABC-type bacteriocin/lantibiotic exporter with double-glycine peptidase domain